MNYLISTFDCVVMADKFFDIEANVKYQMKDVGERFFVFPNSNTIPFMFDLLNPNQQILKVRHGADSFFFLFENRLVESFFTEIKFKNKQIGISLSHKLSISCDGVLICEKDVENLKYSHHEIDAEMCLIYFTGERNFVVVIKNDTVKFASYYDECNVNDNEKYFMCCLNDSLNHGLVCHIKDKEFSKYLVYLDDDELTLKHQFLPLVFLDCVKAENFKYCNALLSENLKMKEEKTIKHFFPEFDYIYPIDETKIILINKNTLAGIYAFEVQNDLIVNIIEC